MQEKFSYALGRAAANYGTMLLAAYATGGLASAAGASAGAAGTLGTASGIILMGAMETGSEAQERIEAYQKKTGDESLEGYTPKMALKNLTAETAYGIGSAILEKKLGFGQQKGLWKLNLDLARAGIKKEVAKAWVKKSAKTVLKSGLSEGGTEMAQEALNIGIDLADGTIEMSALPERLKGMLLEGAVGAVIGGTSGVSAATYNRARAVHEIKT